MRLLPFTPWLLLLFLGCAAPGEKNDDYVDLNT